MILSRVCVDAASARARRRARWIPRDRHLAWPGQKQKNSVVERAISRCRERGTTRARDLSLSLSLSLFVFSQSGLRGGPWPRDRGAVCESGRRRDLRRFELKTRQSSAESLFERARVFVSLLPNARLVAARVADGYEREVALEFHQPARVEMKSNEREKLKKTWRKSEEKNVFWRRKKRFFAAAPPGRARPCRRRAAFASQKSFSKLECLCLVLCFFLLLFSF